MKNKILLLLIISLTFIGCNSDDVEEVQYNPCDTSAQGYSIFTYDNDFTIDDQALTVHYVTGHPQGDYFHIFNNNGPTVTNFYTFAVNSGDTSTLEQNWNTTGGSFLSRDNDPIYGTSQYPMSLTTVQGGSQVGDRILIEFSATGEGIIEGQYCVDIDEVITTSDYVYITDGSDFKIVNVFDPYLPYVEYSVTANTAYFVEVIDNNAYLGYFDAIEPFLNSYDVANTSSVSLNQSIAKSAQFGRLSDIDKIGDYLYVSDEYRGIHHINVSTQAVTSFESHDVMSLSLINNRMTALGIWAGLYGFDVTDPSSPVNSNYLMLDFPTDIDIASYPNANASFHSWIRNNGTQHFVANIEDAKLKKVEEGTLGYSAVSEVDISGYATAFKVDSNYGFITTKASSSAPLQSSFDGITMVDLSNMVVVDSQTLSNASGVTVKSNIAYVTDENGLHIYDVSQGSLNLINTYSPGFGNYISINN
ncbi:hypothetical protein [uncultured Lacinutrix sp.]|uniref:hypothetical protein n=1 Tax=uncultured Lacinutrix sp. TaxID=574032 RepID=UPI00261A0FF3|nr:hypothetical protein [uncultured Lacinutrix sp.]